MSFIYLLVNDWLLTAPFGVAYCVVLTALRCGDLTDGNGLALAILLLFSRSFSLLFSEKMLNLAIYDEAHETVEQKDKASWHLLCDPNIEVGKGVFMKAMERQFGVI